MNTAHLVRRRLTIAAIVAGSVIGTVLTLSPFTVLFAVALVPLFRWGARGLDASQRRCLYTVLGAAIVVRLAVIVGLFLSADPTVSSFATFFGDEEYHELRALWLYNSWLHLPISREAFLYSYSDAGWTSYIPFIAFLQVLAGPAPYGIRLANLLMFLAGSLALFRLARGAVGSAAAFVGLTLLLTIPSLFVWSISALKEPMYLLFVTVALLMIIVLFRRATPWVMRPVALLVFVAACAVIETVRPGGRTLVLVGVGVGLTLRLLAWNRRIALVSALVVPAVLAAALFTVPSLQQRAFAQLRFTANWHRGHVFTRGHSYKSMDERFYDDRFSQLDSMTGAEAVRYVGRSAWAFATMPLPWQIETRSELALVPEQLLLLCMFALLPVGIAAAAFRDPLATCVCCGYSLVSAGTIALTSGNVGTLVRHRALVIPYLVWFSALGAVYLLERLCHRVAERSTEPPPPLLLGTSRA
jgi:hypothetical protein